MLTALLLYGAILPAAAGLLIAGLAVTLLQPRVHIGRGNWSAGLALVVAYTITHAGLIGWPPFPPSESWQWLAWLAPAAWLAGVLEAALARRAPLTSAAIQLAVCFGVGWLVVPEYDEHAIDLRLAAGVAMLILSRGFDRRAARVPAASAAAVLALTFAAAAVVIIQTANAKLGQLAGSLAAAAAGMIVPLFIWTGRGSLSGAGPTLGVLLIGLLAVAKANDYGDVPFRALAPIAFAPLAVSFRRWPDYCVQPRWKRELLRFGVVVALLGMGIAFASTGDVSRTPPESESMETSSPWNTR